MLSFSSRSRILIFQDHAYSPNPFSKRNIENPSSPTSCTVTTIALDVCSHTSCKLNVLFLCLSLELQHRQKPTDDTPMYSSKRRNHSRTLCLSTQHDVSAYKEIWKPWASLQRFLKEYCPFSSTFALAPASHLSVEIISLGRGSSIMSIYCL